MSQHPTLELALFKLKPGIDEAQFEALNEEINVELQTMHGFIKRELFKNSDGQFVDMLYWQTHQDAMNAAEQFPQMACAQPMMAMLDESTLKMLHVEPA